MATTKTKKTPAPAAPKHDPKALPVVMKPKEEITKVLAEMAAGGVVANAALVQRYSEGTLGKDQVSLEGCIEALVSTAHAAHTGDLKKAETMLVAQASTLNAVFCELARRAASNMGEYLNATETYLRLALKAQAQCRATLETLAAIKNPPVVFARQANINNGGQQQVNNGAQPKPEAPPAGAGALPAPEQPAFSVPSSATESQSPRAAVPRAGAG
jgi:hypothetical protein